MYQATRLTLSLGLLFTFEREQSVSLCFTGRDKLDRLLFYNLYFGRNCYVTNVVSDNRNHFVKCSTTQSLNSLSSLRPNFSTGAVYQHLASKLTGIRWQSVSLFSLVENSCGLGMKAALLRFKITLREKLYSFFFCNSRRASIKRYFLVLLITFPSRHLKRR